MPSRTSSKISCVLIIQTSFRHTRYPSYIEGLKCNIHTICFLFPFLDSRGIGNLLWVGEDRVENEGGGGVCRKKWGQERGSLPKTFRVWGSLYEKKYMNDWGEVYKKFQSETFQTFQPLPPSDSKWPVPKQVHVIQYP